MATRSTIALEFADGTVGQVYAHWDGYLDHNGRILLANYQDPFTLQKLIDLGDLSSLAEYVTPEPYTEHTFDKPSPEVCVFYGRDRGETDVGPRYFKDFADYKANHQYEEYEYILRTDGNWYVSEYSGDYKLLAIELAEEEVVGYKDY